jgi:hypothetical protein
MIINKPGSTPIGDNLSGRTYSTQAEFRGAPKDMVVENGAPYLSNVNAKSVDFKDIPKLIAAEKGMLYLSEEEAEKRFNYGNAVALTVGKRVLGFASVIPLLSTDMKNELGLPADIPDVLEVGSVIVCEKLRGHRCAEELLAELLRGTLGAQSEKRYYEEIPGISISFASNFRKSPDSKADSVLVICTTKNEFLEKALIKVSQDLGLSRWWGNHETFPMIAPLTCVCTPNNGGGCGFQYEVPCEVRIGAEELEKGCKCRMWASNWELAEKTDRVLRKFLDVEGASDETGPQKRLVNLLRNVGYYS